MEVTIALAALAVVICLVAIGGYLSRITKALEKCCNLDIDEEVLTERQKLLEVRVQHASDILRRADENLGLRTKVERLELENAGLRAVEWTNTKLTAENEALRLRKPEAVNIRPGMYSANTFCAEVERITGGKITYRLGGDIDFSL